MKQGIDKTNWIWCECSDTSVSSRCSMVPKCHFIYTCNVSALAPADFKTGS